MAKTALTMAETNALRRLGAGPIWSITMTDEFCATCAKLERQGLVEFRKRRTKRGLLDGADVLLTEAGRSML
jgi:hypothetical protein